MQLEEMERNNRSELITNTLDDQHDFRAQLAQMEIDMSSHKWKHFVNRQDEINRDLGDVGLKPSHAQYGIAVAAICNAKRPRSVISVPSGRGKSRIIAAIIAMRAQSPRLFR